MRKFNLLMMVNGIILLMVLQTGFMKRNLVSHKVSTGLLIAKKLRIIALMNQMLRNLICK